MNDFFAPEPRFLYSSATRRRSFEFCPVGYALRYLPTECPDDARYRAKFRISRASWARRLFQAALREYYYEVFRVNQPHGELIKQRVLRRLERETGMMERRDYRRDPKLVPVLLETELQGTALAELYEQTHRELERWCEQWSASAHYEELCRLDRMRLAMLPEPLSFLIRDVIFYLAPTLAFYGAEGLNIVEVGGNVVRAAERTALYRYFALHKLNLAPAAVRVDYYDCAGGCREIPGDTTSFADRFAAWQVEAAMWRDWLLEYAGNPAAGRRFRRTDHCPACRFRDCCPAKNEPPAVPGSPI